MICTFVRCFISMICFFVDKTLLFSAGACENPWRMMNLPLFKTFDRKFRNLLGLYCERHAFFPDHTCTREGEVGDKLWIMNSGPVMLQKKGFQGEDVFTWHALWLRQHARVSWLWRKRWLQSFLRETAVFFLRSWLLFLNFAMKSKYHASIPPVSCHCHNCHNWVTGPYFSLDSEMTPKKTKVVKTVHGHNGGHDCLPRAFAFLASWSRIGDFFCDRQLTGIQQSVV